MGEALTLIALCIGAPLAFAYCTYLFTRRELERTFGLPTTTKEN